MTALMSVPTVFSFLAGIFVGFAGSVSNPARTVLLGCAALLLVIRLDAVLSGVAWIGPAGFGWVVGIFAGAALSAIPMRGSSS